ncbi:TfoX/Sxy family protein [Sulfitobacter sp. JB4-11]|uniref:TfoX/Sxy family protein n=1 Tax=Sulfitobacter rhodophyticola TaxID=3238304 RepID=UPI0035146805
MSLGAADIAFVRDLFSDIPDLTTRRMFGGLGIYSGGVIFALMRSDGQVLLKAQEGPFADHMAAIGGEHWTYTRKNGTHSAMPYWSLPENMLDEPDQITNLANRCLAALN